LFRLFFAFQKGSILVDAALVVPSLILGFLDFEVGLLFLSTDEESKGCW
jgi:hypothetical protein